MNRSLFIFKHNTFVSCHASTITEIPNNCLFSTWFAGRFEGSPDVKIWGAFFNGKLWSSPQLLASHNDLSCWNPVVFFLRKEKLLVLNYKIGISPREWTGVVKFSKDNGLSWSEPNFLPAGVYGPTKNKPLILDDGTWLCGSSTESYKQWACYLEITSNLGKAWLRHGPIIANSSDFGIIQPTLFMVDKTLHMLCRSKNIGYICKTKSEYPFIHWEIATPITNLPNPNSAIDCIKLKDGRILLVYNHSEQTEPAIDDSIPILGRHRLDLAISDDNGQSWRPCQTIENSYGEFSYPAIIQTESGKIELTYTWNRTNIRHISIDACTI